MATKKRGLGSGLKKSLGSGLDAFIDAKSIIDESHQDMEAARETAGDALRQVPVDLIQRGRYQPRRHIDEAALEELAASIRSQGLMQPIVLRPVSADRYEIIAGERRWRAVQKAGLDSIAAIIRDIPDEAAMAMALIENMQREDLNAMEEAMALQRIKDEFNLTHEEVAVAVGKSRSAVTNLMRLTNLPEQVRILVERGDLDMGHARALLPLSPDKQPGAARDIIDRDMSVRQAETHVRALLEKPVPKKTGKTEKKSADVTALEKDLSERLGAPVAINQARGGKGKLVISYASLDILDGILKRIK
ncbi:MAG: ParB/RepB/Spo0J family partition protein [Pseudomonadales bacterium]